MTIDQHLIHCPPLQVAAAVANEINAAARSGRLSLEFTAKFSFASEITKLEDLNASDGLTVDVLPAMDPQWSVRSHDTRRHDIKVKIGIRRRLDTTDRDDDGAVKPDEILAYCNLLYAILDLFALQRQLPAPPAAVWNPKENPTIHLYDEALLKQGVYLGWIHLPFIVHEEIGA